MEVATTCNNLWPAEYDEIYMLLANVIMLVIGILIYVEEQTAVVGCKV